MKTLKSLLSIFALALFFSACANEEEISINELAQRPFKPAELSQAAKARISNFAKDFKGGRINGQTIQFDFDNPSAVQGEGTDIVTIVIPQIDGQANEQYALGFYEQGSDISVSPMIIKTNTPLNGYAQVEYFDKDGTLMASFDVDQNNETVTLAYKHTYSTSGRVAECGNGDEVLACVLDAYEGHGWYSVGLFVDTLFAPEIGLIVVGACGLSTC